MIAGNLMNRPFRTDALFGSNPFPGTSCRAVMRGPYGTQAKDFFPTNMKTTPFAFLIALALTASAPAIDAADKQAAPKSAVAAPAPEKQRELLSSHDTVARFEGLTDHKCLGLTSLCPDRCGESGQLATFTIVKYLKYDKPGEYGDPQQEQFMVLIEDNMGNVKVPKAIRDAIMVLKPGDLVHLRWNHDYVTQAGSKFPERPIKDVTPLTKEQADKLPAEAPAKPKGE